MVQGESCRWKVMKVAEWREIAQGEIMEWGVLCVRQRSSLVEDQDLEGKSLLTFCEASV